MFNYTNCPLCGEKELRNFKSCIDYTVSKETFTIVECVSCGFKFTNPIPAEDRLGKYYMSEDYISHSNTKKGLISKLYHLVRAYAIKSKIKLVSGFVSRGLLLDYGCGTGTFLKAANEAGFEIYGVEPDGGARQIAKNLGLNVFKDMAEFEAEKSSGLFSVITLWHVLEHVPDLNKTITAFGRLLNEGGVIIIAVPNHKSRDAMVYKEHWAAYDVPRHLYHFSRKTIQKLMEDSGFKLVTIKPMKFDSFYVSLLSEKYRGGRTNYLRAFISGIRSNLSARSTGNYSSLIYVFKKA